MCSVTLESFHHMNSKTTLVSLSTTGERSTKAYKIRSRVPQGSFSTKKKQSTQSQYVIKMTEYETQIILIIYLS